MKIHSRLCRLALLFFLHSILLLTSTAIVAAQKPGCDATVEAKLYFKELRTQFIKDRSSVDKSEFRRAGRNYIRLAEQCYELTVGESASGQRIDDGGMWMGPGGATTTDPPVSENFVLFGTKWGAGSPFTGGVDATGPRLPGGIVTYSFMADGVVLAAEAAGLFNVAITSMGSFAPCFLDEIELAFGAWSAVADILFVPVTDGGGPFNTESVADIRIGAHVFDGPAGVLAHGFFPPPNGVTAAGDVHFDSAEPWTCAPGAGSIGFGIIALHELGHAIGLSHELTEIAVMNPFYNAALTFGPLADDIIGAGEIYGEAGAAVTSFFGPVGIGTASPTVALDIERSGNVSIELNNTAEGEDWFINSVAQGLTFSRAATGILMTIAPSGNVGFGTTSPTVALDIERSGNVSIELNNTAEGEDWFINSVAQGLTFSRAATGILMTIAPSGNVEIPGGDLSVSGNLIVIGACADGDGGIGGAADGCDFVFDPAYALESIEEHAAYMWENSHLPAVGPTPDGKKISLNVQQRHFGVLNELEKAHIYIERLNERLKRKEAATEQLNTFVQDRATQLAQVQSEKAVLAKRLARLEALLLAEDR